MSLYKAVSAPVTRTTRTYQSDTVFHQSFGFHGMTREVTHNITSQLPYIKVIVKQVLSFSSMQMITEVQQQQSSLALG